MSKQELAAKKRAYRAKHRAAVRKYQREWYKRNPQARRGAIRATFVKRYGITPEDKARMIEVQGGLCACCADKLRLGRGGAAVDHDHVTGAVRAILCAGCNVAVGYVEKGRMRLAMVYLAQFKNRLPAVLQ